MAKNTEREIVQQIDRAFANLIVSLKDLASSVPPDLLLRSAAVIEQTCGGLTANLWDDPFEWTLPENLSTPERLLAYLDEVETTRRRGFELLKTDEDLAKEVMAPGGITRLGSLLLDSLTRARFELDRARGN